MAAQGFVIGFSSTPPFERVGALAGKVPICRLVDWNPARQHTNRRMVGVSRYESVRWKNGHSPGLLLPTQVPKIQQNYAANRSLAGSKQASTTILGAMRAPTSSLMRKGQLFEPFIPLPVPEVLTTPLLLDPFQHFDLQHRDGFFQCRIRFELVEKCSVRL